ncbi:lipopolysaccharide biosynthesis protein [Oryzobacter terrae]|uniref:lipopolysaccharide biosynthesis protein n=1 Tax=Oryzobacter terrae TaxID=1620385 RepID=UPI00366FC294
MRAGRIVRNTLSNAVGRVVSLALSFVLTPFILDALGETAFGVWVLAQVVVGYGTLLDLGIGAALVRHVADLRARGESHEAALVAGTSTRTYTGLAVLAAVLGGGLAVLAPEVLGTGSLDPTTVTWVFLLVTLGFAVNLAGTPAIASLRGLQRYDLSNAVTVAGALANAALTVLVLVLDGGVVALVAVAVPVAVATQVAAVVMLRREDRRHALRWSPASWGVARTLTRSGSSIVVAQVAGLLQKRSSELVVAGALSAAAVTPFSLARRLGELPNLLSDQFVKVLLPVASELNATGSRGDLRRLYLTSTRVTLALVVPFGLVTAFLAADLLEAWVGAAYRDQAPLVVVLVAAGVASTSQWPAGSVFQGMGRFGPFAVGALVTGVASVVLAVVLVGPYGLTGVAVATLVPTVLEALFFVGPFALRRLGVDLRTLLGTALVPAVVPAVPCAALLLWATRTLDTSGWLALLATGAAAIAVYLAGYLAVPAARAEREALSRAVRLRRR